jgi:glycosyltransferase involved in cell wall biosynthesis
MHVCSLTIAHPAKDARLFYRIVRPLAETGCAVTLIAPEPFEDDLVRMSPWNPRLAQAKRPERLALALRAALAERADVYSFHDPDLILVGLTLKALRPSAAVVYDALEDYPSMMLVKYWLPKPLRPAVAWATHRMNLVAGRWLDGVMTADPHVQQDFQCVAAHKTIVHYNFPPLSVFTPPPEAPSGVKADLVYIGGMSDRTGMFILLDALVMLAQRGIKPSVRLAGYTDGETGFAVLQAGIRSRGLSEQVELRGKLPYTHVPAWIGSGRIGLVALQPIAKFMKNIPTKLFEYWAYGLPVIASDLPPIRPFVSDGKNGLLFDPASAADLARAIERLMHHPHEGEMMGRYGQEQVSSHWNNERQMEGLVNFYQRLRRI